MGLNLILLPRIGIVAAAWSSLAAYAVMAALLYLMVRRIYPVAFELGRMFKIAAAGGVVFLTVSRYLPDASYEGIIARGIFLMGYPIILWGWRLFDAREWAALRSALGFPAHHPH